MKTKAKKAIAGFKIREGFPIGTRSRCGARRMYEFLDRFVTIALPRVRDFRGISGRAFVGRGNYNIGIKEQIVFSPEIEYDKIDSLTGMNISITTTAKNDAEARALLAAFRFRSRTERARDVQAGTDQPQREAQSFVAKFSKKRDALQAIIDNPKASNETRYEARLKIQALPRNSDEARVRNRCALTGRPAASIASSAWAATSSASSRCAARSPASSRPIGRSRK